jgi:hypothetical protein
MVESDTCKNLKYLLLAVLLAFPAGCTFYRHDDYTIHTNLDSDGMVSLRLPDHRPTWIFLTGPDPQPLYNFSLKPAYHRAGHESELFV